MTPLHQRGQAALARLRGRHGNRRMPGDNRRPEHRIRGDPYYQEDWDDDRRNEIFHKLFTLRRTGLPAWPATGHNMLKSTAAPRARQASRITP